MSDRIDEFDQLFRDRLKDQSASPPDSVWNNIQEERSFGHVVANKISSSWRIIGTLLLLAMAGGTSALLLSSENGSLHEKKASMQLLDQASSTLQAKNNTEAEGNGREMIRSISYNQPAKLQGTNKAQEEESTEAFIEQSDLLASTSNIGFARPNFGENRLGILIEGMEGWGTAKPSSSLRFFKMEEIQKNGMGEIVLVKTPIHPEERWDYVIEKASNKGFRDRSSLNFYIGPQFIHKILTPKYNMETAFLQERQKTENTRMAYTAGANIQYELKNHKFLETGIQFTQIYEEVRINGDKRFSNQYDFVEIPFLVGYQDRESKWGWFVKGGLGVQVYNNYKGYILKNVEDRIGSSINSSIEDNAEYRISGNNVVRNIVNNEHSLSDKQDRNEVYDLSSDENPYKRSGIINVHLAAGLNYYYSINTSFNITPYYRQSINSITKESANFNERISTMGIMLGTRVNF